MMQTVLSLVEAEEGVSIVPACVRNLRSDGVCFYRLQPDNVRVALIAAWKKEAPSVVLKAFLDLIDATATQVCSPVLLLGYPTGVNAILARTGAATLQAIAASSKGDSQQVMEELAHHHLIKPVATQGHIGDVLPDKIVYDAQTTSGGSGGPLFNSQGEVIGINFAMVRDFGGSNFAIPVRFAQALLKR